MKLFQPRVISAYQEIQPNTLEAWLISEDSSERELADIELGRMPWEERRFRLVMIRELEKKIKKERHAASRLAIVMPIVFATMVSHIAEMFFKKINPLFFIPGGTIVVVSTLLKLRAEAESTDSLLQQMVKVQLQELDAVREIKPTVLHSSATSWDEKSSVLLRAKR